jgi:hypothetical protein
MGWHVQIDEIPLQTQSMVDPLEKWALDFVGPIHPSSRQKTCTLIFTDYVTKFLEARELQKSIEKAIVEFLYMEIFIIFGVP